MSAESIKMLKRRDFSKSRWTQLPRDVAVGHNAIEQIPEILADIKPGKSALIISGNATREVAGDRVSRIIGDDYAVTRFTAPVLNATILQEAEQAGLQAGAGFIIGVGGGRVIDTAKIVSYNLDIPFISVPTAASHDGIVSGRATLPTENGSVSVEAHPPHCRGRRYRHHFTSPTPVARFRMC